MESFEPAQKRARADGDLSNENNGYITDMSTMNSLSTMDMQMHQTQMQPIQQVQPMPQQVQPMQQMQPMSAVQPVQPMQPMPIQHMQHSAQIQAPPVQYMQPIQQQVQSTYQVPQLDPVQQVQPMQMMQQPQQNQQYQQYSQQPQQNQQYQQYQQYQYKQTPWATVDACYAYQTDDQNLSQQMQMIGAKTKPCTKFFSTSGCPYGESCHFLHFMPTYNCPSMTTNTTGIAPPPAVKTTPTTQTNGVIADPALTVNGYKTKLCNRFGTPEGCRFGDRCHFAHGESDLRPSNRPSNNHLTGQSASGTYANGSTLFASNPVTTSIYYGEPTPPGVPAAATFGNVSIHRMDIEAAYAGAIIGKVGAKVKQISKATGCKVSIRDHETDPNMRSVEMEGTVEQIENASEMVRQLLQSRDVVAKTRPLNLGSHDFKTKLCENFAAGTCTFAERCHFAHGAHELRAVR